MTTVIITVIITVRDTETGRTAEHHIGSPAGPWTEEQAREWVARTEYDPWVFAGVRSAEGTGDRMTDRILAAVRESL